MDKASKYYCEGMLFAGQYLGDWFFLPPARIHNPMMLAITESRRHVEVLGPRSFAKTKVAQAAMMLDGLKLRRLHQVHLGISDKKILAKFREFTDQLDNNQWLHAGFGLRPGRVQRPGEGLFEVRVGLAHPTTVTFEAHGWGASTRSGRLDRILLDDIEDSDESPAIWEQNYVKLHQIAMGALQRTDEAFKGQIVYLCNFVGPTCTGVKLRDIDCAEMPDRWDLYQFSALEDGSSQHLTGVPIGESVWPEFMSTQELQELRRELNAGKAFAFEQEYMNYIVNPSDVLWERDMFYQTYTELPPRHTLAACVAVDPAEKTQDAGDETGIVSIAKCLEGENEGKYYVLDARIDKMAPKDVALETIRQYIGSGHRVNPICDWTYIESKTRKGVGALAELTVETARQENLCLNVQQVVPRTYGDKRQRALKVVDLARNGQILFPTNPNRQLKKLQEQLFMFTGRNQRGLSAIDDGHDAFVWALIQLRQTSRKWSEVKPVTVKKPRAIRG